LTIKNRLLFLISLTILLITSTAAIDINSPEENSFHPGEVAYDIDASSVTDADYVNVSLEGPGEYERRYDEDIGDIDDSRDISDNEYGTYTLTAEAFNDEDESLENASLSDITVDGDSPEINEVSPEDGEVFDFSDPVIEAGFEDSISGLENASIEFDGETVYLDEDDVGETGEVILDLETSDLDDGSYNFDVWVEDRAGNEDSDEWSFVVDTAEPDPDDFEVRS